MTEKKIILNSEYIDDHIKDLSWLNASENAAQFEGLIENLLKEAKKHTGTGNSDKISFPVNIEVKPYIFGMYIEIWVNKFKVGHA